MKEKIKSIQIMLTREEKERIRIYAYERGLNMSSFVRMCALEKIRESDNGEAE